MPLGAIMEKEGISGSSETSPSLSKLQTKMNNTVITRGIIE